MLRTGKQLKRIFINIKTNPGLMKILLTVLMALLMVACKQADKKTQPVQQAAIDIPSAGDTLWGLRVSAEAQGVLGRNLMAKIQQEGTLAALTFCNAEAYRLTDSTAAAKNLKIKRVTDKPRNPGNSALPEEVALIDSYRTELANGRKLKPVYMYRDGERHFYNPIVTSELCLQCHGKPGGQITEEVMAGIRGLYPYDQATGYEANQVRGLWRISETAE